MTFTIHARQSSPTLSYVALSCPEPRRACSLCALFPAPICEGCKRENVISIPFNHFRNSCSSPASIVEGKTPGVASRAFLFSGSPLAYPEPRRVTRHSLTLSLEGPLSPLESALTDELRVLAEISRNHSHVNPLESALTDTSFVSPLQSALTKNRGVEPIMLTAHAKSIPILPSPLLAGSEPACLAQGRRSESNPACCKQESVPATNALDSKRRVPTSREESSLVPGQRAGLQNQVAAGTKMLGGSRRARRLRRLRSNTEGVVGANGFEPSTSWSRTRRASQAALRPESAATQLC